MPTLPDTRPKTILHVFPTFAVGGAQSRFTAIANHFGRVFRHIVVSLDGRLNARERLDPGLDMQFHHVLPRSGPAGSFRSALAFLRQSEADLLVTSNWGAMDWAAAARFTRWRHIHTEDGFGPDEQDGQIGRRVLARRYVLRRSRVVLPSRVLLRIASDIWRLPAANLTYIANGIDAARFTGAVPAELPPGAGPVIGTIAALRPEKNVARLMRAFAAVRSKVPARLIIVGDGSERGNLERLAQTLGIAVDVLFAGHSIVPESWLAAFDLFALSSDTEQMPLSVLEAMAACLPVASTDVGDVRNMLAPENAPFVVPRDDAALAAAILALLGNPDLSRAIGAANQARATALFGHAAMFDHWRQILESNWADRAHSS